LLDRKTIERVARMFHVLAEPTRLEILQVLQKSRHSVSEILEVLDAKQANVSKQLQILHDAELVARERVGNTVYYQIADPLVFELCRLVCGKLQRDVQEQLDSLKKANRKPLE